jgi:enoyl-CoA hydratase/carnithine racemase
VTPDSGELVRLHEDGDVVLVQLHRPEKLNALSTELEQALLDAVRSTAVASSRAVVITGSPRAFSAGADTTELGAMTPERIADYYRTSGAVYEAVASLPQPTVAAVSGYCLGAGLELALACDLRVADETAQFGLPEVGLGILPSSGGITRLVRAVGVARTREIVLVGDRFPAAEAYRLGLLKDVVEAGYAVERAMAYARRLAGLPPLAVAWTKQAIDAAADSPAAVSLLFERLAYAALNRTNGHPAPGG